MVSELPSLSHPLDCKWYYKTSLCVIIMRDYFSRSSQYHQKKKSFQRLYFPQEVFQFSKLKMTPERQIWISVRSSCWGRNKLLSTLWPVIQLSLASVSADSASRRLPGEVLAPDWLKLSAPTKCRKTDHPLIVETLTALEEGFYDGLYLGNPVFRIL